MNNLYYAVVTVIVLAMSTTTDSPPHTHDVCTQECNLPDLEGNAGGLCTLVEYGMGWISHVNCPQHQS